MLSTIRTGGRRAGRLQDAGEKQRRNLARSVNPRQPPAKTDTRAIARRALVELDAAEPNRDAARLLGGELAWDEPMVQFEVSRDPDNARALRPHLIAACQQLSAQPLLGVRCTCGKPLGFVGLAAFATGVVAVTHPNRRRGKQSSGGVADLTLNPTTQSDFSYAPWERALRPEPAADGQPFTTVRSRNEGTDELFRYGSVIGDLAHLRVLQCPNERCRRRYRLTNVQLIRRYLQALMGGSPEIMLGPLPRAQSYSPYTEVTRNKRARRTGKG